MTGKWEPSLTVGYKKLSLNFWANQGLTDKGASGGSDITEFDCTLDYPTSVDAFSSKGSNGDPVFYGVTISFAFLKVAAVQPQTIGMDV